jgi:chromosome segregation ATPase
LEQAEVDKAGLQRRIKDKEKRLAGLEGKVADLEEEKLAQFREYQEELEAQKNLLELQAVDLKKRVSELNEKCESYKAQIQKQQQQITAL